MKWNKTSVWILQVRGFIYLFTYLFIYLPPGNLWFKIRNTMRIYVAPWVVTYVRRSAPIVKVGNVDDVTVWTIDRKKTSLACVSGMGLCHTWSREIASHEFYTCNKSHADFQNMYYQTKSQEIFMTFTLIQFA